MNRSQWLLVATVVLSLYAVGNVWPVQVSSYRLWPYVGRGEFHAYHDAWWHSIWWVILAPAGLLLLAALLSMWWRPPGVPAWALWAGLGLQLALAAGAAAWWGPLMAHLERPDGELLLDRYRLLMATHWGRVAIVTAHGALSVWMLTRSWTEGLRG